MATKYSTITMNSINSQFGYTPTINVTTTTDTKHKVPIGYDEMPHIYHQNCPFPSTISTLSNTPSSTDPTHHPKWHPDPISRFATVHPPDRQTDRPTDGLADRSVTRRRG